MGFLKTCTHIQHREYGYISEYGTEINIKEFTGWTDCPDCVYDNVYKASKNPGCLTCGGKGRIASYNDHIEKVFVTWVTEEGLKDVEVGGVRVGDCRITARYETLDWFKNAINNKTILTIDDVKVISKTVTSSILKTVVNVYGSRTELS